MANFYNIPSGSTQNFSGPILSGETPIEDIPAQVPTSLWNGTSAEGTFGTHFNWEYTQPWTISIWINPSFQQHPTSGEARQVLISNAHYSFSTNTDTPPTMLLGWGIDLIDWGDDVNLSHSVHLSSDYSHMIWKRCEGPISFPVDTGWALYTSSYDGSGTLAGIKNYKNGQIVTDTITSSSDNLSNRSIISDLPTMLGRDGQILVDDVDVYYRYKGLMRNINIWNRALSDENILSIFNNGRFGNNIINGPENMLACYFSRTNSLIDETGNGYDGDLTDVTFIMEDTNI